MEVKERAKNFINELGVPTSKFAKNVGISVSAFNKWQSGELSLCHKRLMEISDYLSKYNF